MTLLCTGILLACQAAFAAGASESACVEINRVDGKTDHIAVDKSMEIAMSPTGDIRLTNSAVSIDYPMEEVASFTVGRFAFAEGSKYDGDKAGMADVAAPALCFGTDGTDLTVSGATPGGVLELYTVSGMKAAAVTTDSEGCARINTQSLGRGVYILTINGISLKITL